jgi:hypothetical protein
MSLLSISLSNIPLSRLTSYVDEIIGIIFVGFGVTDELLVSFFSAFVRYWTRHFEYNETVHQPFIDFKKFS